MRTNAEAKDHTSTDKDLKDVNAEYLNELSLAIDDVTDTPGFENILTDPALGIRFPSLLAAIEITI